MKSKFNNAARGINLFSKMALEEKSVATPGLEGVDKLPAEFFP